MARRNSNTNVKNTPATLGNFEVIRAVEWDNGDVSFDLSLTDYGIKLYGLRIAQSKEGKDFIAFPSRKGKDGKYYSHYYFFVTDEQQAAIIKAVDAKLNN